MLPSRPQRQLKPTARLTFSPNQTRAFGQRYASQQTRKTPTKSVPSPGPLEPDASSVATPLEPCSSPSTASKSPDAKRVKLSPLTQFLNKDTNVLHAKSNIVDRGYVHIKKTPHPDKRRFRDATKILFLGLDQLSTQVFNNTKWSKEDRIRMMQPHVMKYFRKNGDVTDLEQKMVDMMHDTCELIKSQSPEVRRPVMAMFTQHFTKEEAQSMISPSSISKYEWKKARQHAKHPGPYKPIVKPKTRRARFSKEVVLQFLGHLECYLQDHAYGDKNAVTTTGAIVQLDAVSTTAQTNHIMREYIKIHHHERLTRDEGGCHKKCPKLGVYCLKREGHSGQHKFTDDTMLSASSIESVIAGLTAGRLKSMAGLDDEDVKKGSGNIERLKEIYSILATANNTNPSEVKTMNERIDRIVTYHRTGFISHLQRHGDRCCQCISCGLHCEKDEPIHCPIREDKSKCHKGPCSDCEESFLVFSDLLDIVQATQHLDHIKSSAAQREQFYELEVELKKCLNWFKHWRSHIVRKEVESQYFRKELQELGRDELICQCDFKMKILQHSLKETKEQFFGKRGTACLGFMLMSNAEQKEGVVDVHFYVFFSDDTTQDTNFVLSAKHYIYNNIAPSLFPEGTQVKIKFESDGAGCFNSHLAKATMPFWDEWTGGRVVEIQIRHSVNGAGKSPLDGFFGKMGRNILDAVDNGLTDIYDARSCLKAFDEGAGIEGSSAYLLEINREHDLKVVKKTPILLKSHRIVYEPHNKRLIAYGHSGYGDGTEIDLDVLESMFKSSPGKPQYTVGSSAESNGTSQHSTESYESRVQRKTASKRQATNDALEAKEKSLVDKAKQGGVLYCDALDTLTKARCQYKCTQQKALEAHKQSGNHQFPARNLKDQAIGSANMEGGQLAYGSRANRSQVHSSHNVSDGIKPVSVFDKQFGAGSFDTYFGVGCYRKPPREKAVPYHAELKRILIKMFEDGESADGEGKKGKNKYTPKSALESLRSMCTEAGLRKFSSTSDFGELPTESQIKSFWARYKAERNKTHKDEEWVDAALETIDEENDNEEENDGSAEPTKKHRAENGNESKDKGRKENGNKRKGKGKCKGKLTGKVFVLDGKFEAYIDGGNIAVTALIESHGGKILSKLSKNVDFVVMGDKPSKAHQLHKHKKANATDYNKLRLYLDGGSDGIGVSPDKEGRLLSDTNEEETASVSEFTVQSHSYGIEVSPKKGTKLFP